MVGAAAAGVSKLPGELTEILQLIAAHGANAALAALQRAVEFRRWRAADVRSILAAGGAAPTPRPARRWYDPAHRADPAAVGLQDQHQRRSQPVTATSLRR